VNVASMVLERARSEPDAPAIYHPVGRDASGNVRYACATNRELDRDSDWLARGLEMVGIERGMRTAVMVRPSLDFFALMLALFKLGAVPVLVDPGIGLRRLGRCLEEAEPEAFVGIPVAHAARLLLGWGSRTLRVTVTVGRRWFWRGATLDGLRVRGRTEAPYPVAQTNDEDVAAILFTSGSTGPPKGVVYSHANFAAQVEAIRELGNIEDGEIDLPTFPPFALFDPALGMTAVVPDMDPTRPGEVDPRRIIDAAEQFRATNLFGSPALLDTVGRYGARHGVKLSTLRRIVSAGAPVSASVMARFLEMLPDGAVVQTPYGATECLPVSCISSREVLSETAALTDTGAGVCVGLPVPSIDARIIAIDDGPIETWGAARELPRGEIGEITVRGAQTTDAYYNRPHETALAKIRDEDGAFWHRMGDLGYFDAHGRLWYCGRKADRVTMKNETLFTVNCEAIFDTHPKVRRSALVRVPRGEHQEPVLCVELLPDVARSERSAIERTLFDIGARHTQTKNIARILFHRRFPVDIRHNAKIGRSELARWATRKLRGHSSTGQA